MKEIKIFLEALQERLGFKDKVFSVILNHSPFNIPAIKHYTLTVYLTDKDSVETIVTSEKTDRVITESEKEKMIEYLAKDCIIQILKKYGI